MGVPGTVVVAMSGGVDSSVAAGLLVEQGYQVIGMMLRLWSEQGEGLVNRCCSPEAMSMARRVAAKFGIPFYAIDVQEEFRNTVVQAFIDGYEQGITPNPCLTCNRKIRWGLLMEHARAFGADYLATGHYARVEQDQEGRYHLWQGVDRKKDQSYVLSVLNQDLLAHSLFPLGRLTKPEVRQRAKDFGLPVAERAESQDLCFIADGNYRRFLSEHAPRVNSPGPIRDPQGEVIGQHQGLAFYTIGQRKGIQIAAAEPFYVIGKNIHENALVVGPREALGRSSFTAHSANWLAEKPPVSPFRANVRIRYKAPDAPGLVTPLTGDRFRVDLDQPARDITPGQGAVVYTGEECLGGGIIELE